MSEYQYYEWQTPPPRSGQASTGRSLPKLVLSLSK